MSAVIANIKPRTLNGRESFVLDRVGKLDAGNGSTLHRGSPDALPEVPTAGKFTTRTELAAVAAACQPLGQLEQRQRGNDLAVREAHATGERHKLAAIRDEAEELKEQHAPLRGAARVAIIATADAAARRAGAEYNAACSLVGQAFAKLQALAEFRDSLTGRNDFDPMGSFQRMALLAPASPYRPAGWCIGADAYGRATYWSADSPAHREEVRRVQQAFRNELTPAVAAAAWPF